jgi:putative ABC transport system substrate-binding protein
VRRRAFIALLGGGAAWPVVVRAQQPARLARIGYLNLTGADDNVYGAFRAGLRELGYVEGGNLHLELRYAEGREDRLADLATELVALKVDVIVTYATGVYAAQRATKTIPIVMATHADAVALVSLGLVSSLAHPGGNVTGSTFFVPEIMAKRLEILKELAPSITRAGVLLIRREDQVNQNIIEAMGATAKALSVHLQPIEVRGADEIESAFSRWAESKIGGLVMVEHAQLNAKADAIAALAAKLKIPSVGPLELPEKAGLIGYGVNFADMFRRTAIFVDKILKGAKPGDIPVEQASQFKSVLNLKTAKALGLDVPSSILLRADQVIE